MAPDISDQVIPAEQLRPHYEKVYREADDIVHYFIWGYFFFGLFLSIFYDTWVLGIVMGSISISIYYFFRSLFQTKFITRIVISLLLWNFTVQFILQMHGMFEMYFFYFVSLTVLLFYEDIKILIPAMAYAIITFLFIFYFKLSGNNLNNYLENVHDLTYINAIIHIAILLLYGGIAMLWALKQRKQTEEAGKRQFKMKEQLQQMEVNIDFANSISQGNLTADYKVYKADRLGESLMNMRTSLVAAKEREERERFVNIGLTTIGEVLRSHSDDLDELCDKLIENLVDYMNVNQGGVFIIEQDQSTGDDFLELKAARAYERKKFLEKRIEMGQGLVGQCAIEKEKILLREIPENYVNITSGLGLATPRSLLIMPLKSNEELVGIIELASFKDFSDTDIEFLEKVGESTAATIISVKTNQQTRELLEQSRQMAEEMQAQEEEMRQNMEEMQATQEEMSRTQQELAQKESKLNALLNNTKDTILAINKDYKITVVNKILKEKYAKMGIDLATGVNILEIFSADQRQYWKEKYDRALAGESSSEKNKQDNRYVETYYFPIKDEMDRIVGAAVISRDISDVMEVKEEVK
jgi:methyl-accepting chemotaxis protein